MNLTEIIEKIDELTDNQRTTLVKDTVEKMGEQGRQAIVTEGVKSLSPTEKTEIVRTATENLTTAEKQAFLESVLGQPTQKATDTLWLIIVIVFAIGLVVSILAMIYLAVLDKEISDKLITIFTTTSAFLAALIAPSPMSR